MLLRVSESFSDNVINEIVVIAVKRISSKLQINSLNRWNDFKDLMIYI